MNESTKILCIECNQYIKRNEGFVPLEIRGVIYGRHHPDCEHPCTANQTKMYNPKRKIHNYMGEAILL